ncbi:MAG: MMPL family transporter [Actinomycetota bacterium]|nr:MMPL family transporter [Actinomycetota bacterium]
MFEALGRFAVARRWWVVVVTIVFAVVAGVIGGGVADRLSNGGFDDPNAEAVRAADALEDEFGVNNPNLALLVTVRNGSVDDPANRRAGLVLTDELADEDAVEQVVSYWTTGVPALRSDAGDRALVVGVIDGTEDVITDRVEELSESYTRETDAYTIQVGGFAEVFRQVGTTIEEDLVRAESLAFPITLALLILVFGSLVAAGLPLIIGGISIVGSFLILTVISEMTLVSIFALNLVTAMGLGLAIDYSLFVVSRFREELRKGLEVEAAVVETVRTAGRTVAFSGVTVALSLAALLVFPLAFLRSFAYAGVAVVMLAALASTVFLPALLAVLGRRVDKFSWRRGRGTRDETVENRFWHRLALLVMRRPLPIATVVIALLLVLGVPFLRAEFGRPDDRVLPADASSHEVAQILREEFPVNATNNVNVVAPDAGDPEALMPQIAAYSADLSRLDGVYAVQGPAGSYVQGRQVARPDASAARFVSDEGTWFSVVPSIEAVSPAGERLVNDIRTMDAPFDVLVGGLSADLVDTKSGVFDRMPVAALLIGVTTFVLLFLMFGGLLVPLKAIVLNLLSLTATFGALVWIFQDGNLSEQLDFMATGTIDITTPVLMFCIAFGLSMDYEVFLLSRIKEEHDITRDNTASVALGLERTGRIVTAAAALLSIVFLALVTSSVTFIKLFGVGLTLAVVMDATLIRAVLVPAFMRLAGEANWWAPTWLRRIHKRFGISEAAAPLPAGAGEGGSR